MTRTLNVVSSIFLFAGAAWVISAAQPQANKHASFPSSSPAVARAHDIPVMDGGAGPCSLALSATTSDGKPVYAASVKVHIAYGFGGIRRLDLEASTNVDGKVKFVGLPARVHQPPLEFKGSYNRWVGLATYDPDTECQAKHDIVLDMPRQPQPSN